MEHFNFCGKILKTKNNLSRECCQGTSQELLEFPANYIYYDMLYYSFTCW